MTYSTQTNAQKIREVLNDKIEMGIKLNGRDLVFYFCNYYKEVFNCSYTFLPKHFTKMKFLATQLSNDEMLDLIEYFIDNYKELYKEHKISGEASVDVLYGWINAFQPKSLNYRKDKDSSKQEKWRF